jgi:hypothetical protein
LYRKTIEHSEKNVSIQVKNTHDPEKWKKKFIMVFNREKVIDFTGGLNLPQFDVKHLNVKLRALNKQGERILKQSAKFWIVFLKLLPEKVVEAHKEELRNDLINAFKDSSLADYQLIFSELGDVLDIQANASSSSSDKENRLPSDEHNYEQHVDRTVDFPHQMNNEEEDEVQQPIDDVI